MYHHLLASLTFCHPADVHSAQYEHMPVVGQRRSVDSRGPTKPDLLPLEKLLHLESMDGFLFLLAEDGRILFISENVNKFIGLNQINLKGNDVSNSNRPRLQRRCWHTSGTGECLTQLGAFHLLITMGSGM